MADYKRFENLFSKIFKQQTPSNKFNNDKHPSTFYRSGKY